MIHYARYCKLIRDSSEEKIKQLTMCNWYGNTILVILIAVFMNDFLFFLLCRFSYFFYLLAYLFLFFIMILYLATRRAGIGMTEHHLIYAQCRHIGIKIKDYYEIPLESIRSISVRKILNAYFISFSFISSVGKLEKKRVYFSKKYIGFNSDEVMKNRFIIAEQLTEMQKILDRGDFRVTD